MINYLADDAFGRHGGFDLAVVVPTSIGDDKVEPVGRAVAILDTSIGLYEDFARLQWRTCDMRPVSSQTWNYSSSALDRSLEISRSGAEPFSQPGCLRSPIVDEELMLAGITRVISANCVRPVTTQAS